MERFVTKNLLEWKNSKYRKPLILRGARQVGKTYIVKKFAEENYQGLAYFNFDHDENLQNLFVNTKDPKRILEQLSFIYGKAIVPGETLIFFDEIQECPDALNSLKYFQEEANGYHIISARKSTWNKAFKHIISCWESRIFEYVSNVIFGIFNCRWMPKFS